MNTRGIPKGGGYWGQNPSSISLNVLVILTKTLTKLVLLRFAKKSPTSSQEVDVDVRRPDIDVEHCRKNTEKLRNYLEHRNGRPLFLKLETKYEERSQRSKAEAKEYGSK